MRKVRVTAAMLAILTALIDALFCLSPDSDPGVLLLAALGAVCLAIVVPVDALQPATRRLVVAGCAGFVVAIGTAAWRAQQVYSERTPGATLLALFVVGVGLAIWAFLLRNRRRRPGWTTYYDH